MTPLGEKLVRRIRLNGPMTIAEFMTECLHDPTHGYYATRDPLGTTGDFITAPEISQMFGELIGLCLAQTWIDQGRPDPFVLAEAGPGRGNMMADLLRATASVPGFHDAMRLCLIEASPALRDIQRSRLAGTRVSWCSDLVGLPPGPLFLIANEFLDALPIRQFMRTSKGWSERVISEEDGVLGFGLGHPAPHEGLAHRLDDTRNGMIVETSAARDGAVDEIAARIAAHGGAALMVDYGDWRSRGDTFQALRNHAPVDPLECPGEADLTAHVDFEAVAVSARRQGAAVSSMTTQGVFLERLGITARATALLGAAPEASREQHIAAHRRLTHRAEMGHLFKAMSIHPADMHPPPGLDP